MDRLISEQKAIEAINDYWGEMETPTIDGCINAIKTIPSAEPSGDLISRQAVLDCLTVTGLKKYDYILNARNKIKNLPSVKPQEKTGHWIEKMDACECPYCHKAWDYYDNDTEDFDYCPKCGAKLSENPTGSEPQKRSK